MIEAKEIQGRQAKYNLYFRDGELISCSCPSRQYRKEECRHMTAWRQEQADKAAMATSCVYCGRASKSGLCFVCGGC